MAMQRPWLVVTGTRSRDGQAFVLGQLMYR